MLKWWRYWGIPYVLWLLVVGLVFIGGIFVFALDVSLAWVNMHEQILSVVFVPLIVLLIWFVIYDLVLKNLDEDILSFRLREAYWTPVDPANTTVPKSVQRRANENVNRARVTFKNGKRDVIARVPTGLFGASSGLVRQNIKSREDLNQWVAIHMPDYVFSAVVDDKNGFYVRGYRK